MKLAHPYYFQPIEIDSSFPVTLVIENPQLFRKMIFEIMNQCDGADGEFVLSENNGILEFSRNCILISDICHLNFVSRDIKSRVQKILEEEISNEDETNLLISSIEQFAVDTSDHFQYPLKYRLALQPSDLIKLLNFEIDEEDALPMERMIDYMEIYASLLQHRLIITVNVKDYLSSDEYHDFQNDLINRQITVLMLERHTHSFDDPDNRIILDEDLCEI